VKSEKITTAFTFYFLLSTFHFLLSSFHFLAAAQRPAPACTPVGRPLILPAVPEASGVAQAAGALWTHNDSGAPVLFRIDPDRRVTPVVVTGATVVDWEDIAIGSCSGADCLYIADIGDNRLSRQRITIYQVAIPPPGSASTAPAHAFHATYPDAPHDAEALLVTSSATFIITKDVPPRVYRFQSPVGRDEAGRLSLFRELKETFRITAAAVSPDGRWIALRSNTMLLVYTTDGFLKSRNPVRVDLSSLNEPQGEGVTFGSGGDLYLVSEGRGKGAAGMLTRIHCAFIE
jgi:hypothetical protein